MISKSSLERLKESANVESLSGRTAMLCEVTDIIALIEALEECRQVVEYCANEVSNKAAREVLEKHFGEDK